MMKPVVPVLLAPLLRCLYLRGMRFKRDELEGLTFRVADSLDDKEAAFQLVHEMYVRRGIISRSECDSRLSVFHLLPTTTIFIAKSGDQVIGTVSLIEDSPLGVPMEETHPREILTLRLAGWRFAEVGALAVTAGLRGKGVPLMLYNIMFRWARQYRLIRNLALAVHPRIARFFEIIFLAERLGPVRTYAKLNDALSSPLSIELLTAPVRFRELYDRPAMHIGRGTEAFNFYKFFCEDRIDNLLLPELSRFLPPIQPAPVWSHAEIASAFRKRGLNVRTLPRQHRRVLLEYYPEFRDMNQGISV